MNRFRRVMLVTPPYHCGMVESAGVWMPLGLAYLAGSLKANGFEPIDLRRDVALRRPRGRSARELERQHPDVVATTAYTATVNAATEVLRLAKALLPGVTTVIGGVHPSHMAAEVLDDDAVDFVVRGEGEAALPELLACLRAGDDPSKVAGVSFRSAEGAFVHGPARPLTCDLGRLPDRLGLHRLAAVPLPHEAGVPPGHHELVARLHERMPFLLAAPSVARHLARPRRRVDRGRAQMF